MQILYFASQFAFLAAKVLFRVGKTDSSWVPKQALPAKVATRVDRPINHSQKY